MNLPDTPSPPDAPAATWTTTTARLFRLMRKELSEVLRDRRTIMTLILMPVLLYPLLAVGFQQFLFSAALETAQQEAPLRIGFLPGEEETLFRGLEQVLGKPATDNTNYSALYLKSKYEVADDVVDKLKAGQLELVVRIKKKGNGSPDFDDPAGQARALKMELLYLNDSPRSVKALGMMERQLNLFNTILVKQALAKGPPVTVLRPEPQEIALPRGDEFPLASVIPLVLILMTITGAVYPAIDLTAGERERGTLEILVAAPVPRMGLLFAKYVSVLTVAMLTAVVNLTMMIVTVWLSGIGQALFEDGFTVVQILQIFALLLLFAAFFSAVLLTMTSFARSFKEAQAYLIPLMLVSLGPGVAGMIPGLELTPALCLVPLLNIVLLGRDLFHNQGDALLTTIVVISTLTYAVAAIAVAAKVFGAENVLYSESSSWADLFRRPLRPVETPSLSSALVCLGLMFSAFFVVQGFLVRQIDPREISDELLIFQVYLMAGLSVVLFAVFPLVSAQRQHVRWGSGFLLRPAPPLVFLGALLLGASLWPLVHEVLAYLDRAGLTTMPEERRTEILASMQRVRGLVPVAVMIAVQVLPGLVEELFFRGFLLSSLRKLFNGPVSIVISAVLFGLAHWVITPVFGLERLILTTLLGLVLGWVAWRSGSVLPAMLLHGCHNGILAWLGYQQPGEGGDAALGVNQLLLIAVAVVGAGLVWLGGRSKQKKLRPIE